MFSSLSFSICISRLSTEGTGSGLDDPKRFREDGARINPSLARLLCFMKLFLGGTPSPGTFSELSARGRMTYKDRNQQVSFIVIQYSFEKRIELSESPFISQFRTFLKRFQYLYMHQYFKIRTRKITL